MNWDKRGILSATDTQINKQNYYYSKTTTMTNYWLFKSEPTSFSIHNLKNCKQQTTSWDGVRNYQARNFLRDECKLHNQILFYHSNADPPSVVGTATITKESYPDSTAFDPKHHHYDPKSNPLKPTWYMVNITLKSIFKRPVSLPEIKEHPKLQNMTLVKPGTRLSIQKITALEFEEIVNMGT